MRLIDADAALEVVAIMDCPPGVRIAAEHRIDALPAVDAVPVVRCGECIYWQKPQIRTLDGMYRDYLPDEVDHLLGCHGVTADIGINVGGYCNGYWVKNYVEDGRHEWKGKYEFCSRGERRDDDESEG